jgi:hypothetical protein
MTEHKFFSEDWCQVALKTEQALTEEMLREVKGFDKFSHIMAFEVADRPGVIVHGEYIEGHIQTWTAENLFPEDKVWVMFKGKLANFQEAVTGNSTTLSLVMKQKLRLVKGSMKDSIENAPAMDRLLRHWGTVPTDWDI